MIRKVTTVLFAAFLLAGVQASVAMAHDGHAHTLMGTLTMGAADHVMLKLSTGRDATVLVTQDTKVIRDKRALKIQDIKVGTRIVVTAITENNKTTATEIQVGEDPKP